MEGIHRVLLQSSLPAVTWVSEKAAQVIYKVCTALEIRTVVRRDSSVDIASRYGLEDPGIESRWGDEIFRTVQADPGAHPASCAVGTCSLSSGVTRPRRDVVHMPHIAPRLKKG